MKILTRILPALLIAAGIFFPRSVYQKWHRQFRLSRPSGSRTWPCRKEVMANKVTWPIVCKRGGQRPYFNIR